MTDPTPSLADRFRKRVDLACSPLAVYAYEHHNPDGTPGYDAELDLRAAAELDRLGKSGFYCAHCLTRFEVDDLVEHIAKCENNPQVKRITELEAIVATLPVTADDVRVTVGMIVFAYLDVAGRVIEFTVTSISEDWFDVTTVCLGDRHCASVFPEEPPSSCYSTQAAAHAAQIGGR